MIQNIEQILADLNQNKSSQEYHKLLFSVYENGYNFTNHWHTINSVNSTSEFYNSIRWSIDTRLHDKAIKLAEKMICANKWMNSSVIELHKKDALHYFTKNYNLRARLFKHLREGNMETFCNTHQHYVDVLHPAFHNNLVQGELLVKF